MRSDLEAMVFVITVGITEAVVRHYLRFQGLDTAGQSQFEF